MVETQITEINKRNKMNEIERISPSEFKATDPITGGTWRVVSTHQISEYAALIAIAQTISEKDIRPGKGTTTTVHFEIKIEGQQD
jgi:hypothetical protein